MKALQLDLWHQNSLLSARTWASLRIFSLEEGDCVTANFFLRTQINLIETGPPTREGISEVNCERRQADGTRWGCGRAGHCGDHHHPQ